MMGYSYHSNIGLMLLIIGCIIMSTITFISILIAYNEHQALKTTVNTKISQGYTVMIMAKQLYQI